MGSSEVPDAAWLKREVFFNFLVGYDWASSSDEVSLFLLLVTHTDPLPPVEGMGWAVYYKQSDTMSGI